MTSPHDAAVGGIMTEPLTHAVKKGCDYKRMDISAMLGGDELEVDEESPPMCLPERSGSVPTDTNQNHTPPRSVRVPDLLWEATKRVAAERGESVSEATNRFYARYVKDHARKQAMDTDTPLEQILRRLGA